MDGTNQSLPSTSLGYFLKVAAFLKMGSWKKMLLHLTMVVVSFLLVDSVDKGNFKTCSQSGFCKRQRDHKPNEPLYKALMETLQTGESFVKLQLLNKRTSDKLLLEIYGLKDKTLRVKINEVKPNKVRYEIPVGDTLVAEPEQGSLKVKSRTSSGISLTLEDHSIVIQASPFRIDIVTDNTPVLVLNSQSLLKVEPYRTKNAEEAKEEEQVPADDENEEEEEEVQEEEEKEEVEEKEEPDLWEETFKTHQDTKPYGPSSVGMDLSFPGFEFVYGIPEHADDLALKSTKGSEPYRLYNLDVFEYEVRNPMALYGSVPVMLAHNEERSVGVFWQNAAETWIDISSKMADRSMFSKLVDLVKGGDEIPQVDTHWFSESGIIDIFVMLGPEPADIFRQYAALTGTTPLPPLFSIAYHQSRWNYNDEQDVANVDAGFDEHDIPMDVIWLDIEHTDGKRYFTWDAHKFPHSEDMLNNISAKGRKMVTIVDPHIKKDSNYFVFKEAQDQGFYIKNKDGADYEGWCWPGSSYWPDYIDPKIRDFWANKFLTTEYKGSTNDLYIWNDMNEPSVFNGPEITMHKDAKHMGGWEHRDVHNLYGAYVHRATYEGLMLRGANQERPFVLSRAFFAGSQRYGAVWTGDNTGEWSHLKMSLPMLQSLSLVGITFCGADIGGFFKNPEPELLTRWYQAAAYQPFFRAHAHLDTRRREPWLQPEEHTKAIRESLRGRYRLLPYWYTLFYHNELNGMPPMRPLWVEFPQIKETFGIEDAHMVGPAIIVKPVTDAGATSVSVFLPGDDEMWYDRDTYQRYTGGQHISVSVNLFKTPAFQRGGFIVPMRNRIRRSANLMRHDPYTLVTTINAKAQAEGDLYEDDYSSFQYKNGRYVHRKFTFDVTKFSSTNLHPGSNSGFTTDSWIERILIVGYPRPATKVILASPGSSDVELGSAYDTQRKVLTIRKPGINLDKDFVISIL